MTLGENTGTEEGASSTTRDRLEVILDGFPQSLVSQNSFQRLRRFCVELDVLGRLDAKTGEPLVDEHTLRAGLREFVDEIVADRLVRLLSELPAASFRPARQVGSPTIEVSWFGLANKVIVFDPSPTVRFRELTLPAEPCGHDVIVAIRRRFPSMEEEFLSPDKLPSRIDTLLRDENRFHVLLHMLVRQLGWWAALVAVLLVPPTTLVKSEPQEGKDRELLNNVWPLSMYLLLTAIGGWTLTVVGSCILAPSQ